MTAQDKAKATYPALIKENSDLIDRLVLFPDSVLFESDVFFESVAAKSVLVVPASLLSSSIECW